MHKIGAGRFRLVEYTSTKSFQSNNRLNLTALGLECPSHAYFSVLLCLDV